MHLDGSSQDTAIDRACWGGITGVGLYGSTEVILIPVAPPREYTRPFTNTIWPT